MKTATALQLACSLLLACASLVHAQTTPAQKKPAVDYSGIYTFLRDGEFVQITIDDPGHVIGFVSRYVDPEDVSSGFVDQFFDSAKLDGNQLTFTTKPDHGLSFEFRGTVERGEGKIRADEAYYVLKGTVVETTTDAAKKTSSHSQEVVLKGFPQNLAPPPPEKK